MSDPLLTAVLVVLVNGGFLLVGKLWADRTLAAERAAREVLLEAFKSQVSLVRDLAIRSFDRRADLYWAALEPFVQLFVVNLSRPSTPEEIETFRRDALLASSRLSLFAAPTVASRYEEMFQWTDEILRSRSQVSPAQAREHAQVFVAAAQEDLLLPYEPQRRRLPPI